MSQKTTEPTIPSRYHWPWLVAGIFLLLLLAAAGTLWGYQQVYANKFYRGTGIANIDLGGKTYNQAEEILKNKIDEISRNGFLFTYQDRQVVINPSAVSTTDPDISYNLVTFNQTGSLAQAWQIGRNKNYLISLTEQLGALFGNKKIPCSYQLDEGKILSALKENFFDRESPGSDARLILTKAGDLWQPEIIPEKTGKIFSYQAAINQLRNNLNNLDSSAIELNLVEDRPQITEIEAQKTLGAVKPILAKAPLTLAFSGQKWEADEKTLAELLGFFLSDGKVALGLNAEKFALYMDKEIALAVNQQTRDAKLTMNNGRVVEFQSAQEGREINQTTTLEKIYQDFITGDKKEVELIIDVTQPKVLTKDVNDLGITEIIGTGLSNFASSPVNRRYNIKNGANILNGLIIKPNEEFSLLNALGPVDETTGYRTELVIKGNKTIPEYGGGLCQIGTTIFRSALASGLPITERQPHSYRVSYYEPAGLDATIYIPRPDVKFVNDTGHHILIQAKIKGDSLKFEFWGTKDGRAMKYSGQTESGNLYDIKPKIGSLVYPPPTKYIESVDIPVGSQKCTEKSHVGATTEFTYQVAYPGGETKEQTFHSVYKPWQAVCLVGVEKLSTPEQTTVEQPTDSSTNTNTNPTN